jgi:hypothetical protein
VRSCDVPGREKITDFPGKYLHVPTTSLDARCSCMCLDHIIYIHSQIKIIRIPHVPTEDLCFNEIHYCFPCPPTLMSAPYHNTSSSCLLQHPNPIFIHALSYHSMVYSIMTAKPVGSTLHKLVSHCTNS